MVGDFLDPSPCLSLGSLALVMDKDTLRVGNQPVGGRLAFFAHQWENDFYRKSLKEGWRFRWVEDPPHIDKGEEVPDLEEDRKALLEMNQELLDKRAVEVCPPLSPPGCIFKMFLVDKKASKEQRPGENMRPISPFGLPPHFKMEGLAVARELIDQGPDSTSRTLISTFPCTPSSGTASNTGAKGPSPSGVPSPSASGMPPACSRRW